jgi:hypothetical protein
MYIEPLEQRQHLAGDVLFVRGADRSGGFLEATTDFQRTEQLSDINNASTSAGNHGWKQLADRLRDQGYRLTQITETVEPGAAATGQTMGRAVNFAAMNLSEYELIVLGSNNAVYNQASVNAIENYVRNGGGVLFISDGNFGSSWRDSPDSDQQFLNRFGVVVNQDNGRYALERTAGDFALPNEPVLFGVNAFDGEGVSPAVIPQTAPDGVSLRRVSGARGITWNNDGTSSANSFQGSARAVRSDDASLILGNAGAGRLAVYFDRNTFFNANGAGTDITRFDNRQFATNLFNWASDNTPPAITSTSFRQASPHRLSFSINDNLNGSLTRGDIRLRNRVISDLIPRNRWSMTLTETNGQTNVTIRIRSSVQAGRYQLQIGRRAFSDDSGNIRIGVVRYNLTINSINAPANISTHQSTFAQRPYVKSVKKDWLMSIFSEVPIMQS